jgi:ribosomal protein S27E
VSGAESRVACSGCGRSIVPRLWHYGGGRLTYVKRQHLCPFCGAVLYESGGGLRLGCKAALIVFSVLFVALFALIVAFRLAREFSR